MKKDIHSRFTSQLRLNIIIALVIFCLFPAVTLPQEIKFSPLNSNYSVEWLQVPEINLTYRYTPSGYALPDTIKLVPSKPKLLPDNMSLMENIVWGEKGILRGVGIASELTPDVRKNELQIRRAMLSAHQVGGFVTLGLMIATAYYGQRIIDGHRELVDTKKTLADFTIASYTLTGLLSILSPPPSIRRDGEFSSISLHKTLAWVHVAGMIVTPILATLIEKNHVFNMDKAHVHQIAGYLTTTVFALSMIVITF